jgi:hypothetical protein
MKFPLSKSQKVLMLVLTVLPFVFFGLYFFQFYTTFFKVFPPQLTSNEVPELFKDMGRLMLPFFLGFISQMAVYILYLLHAIKNPRLTEGNDRLVWILVLIFAGPIGSFIYWRLQVWLEKEKRFQEEYDN